MTTTTTCPPCACLCLSKISFTANGLQYQPNLFCCWAFPESLLVAVCSGGSSSNMELLEEGAAVLALIQGVEVGTSDSSRSRGRDVVAGHCQLTGVASHWASPVPLGCSLSPTPEMLSAAHSGNVTPDVQPSLRPGGDGSVSAYPRPRGWDLQTRAGVAAGTW